MFIQKYSLLLIQICMCVQSCLPGWFDFISPLGVAKARIVEILDLRALRNLHVTLHHFLIFCLDGDIIW